jgi:uncharacterized protein
MTDASVLSFSAMLRQALGDSLASDANTFVDMFAENGVMEFPYAPPGLTTRLDGRQAVAAHLQSLSGEIAFDRMSAPKVYQTNDAGIFVLEFMGFGKAIASGEPYEQTYISVIKVRDGHIVHYRDYWNPLVLLKTTGGKADFAHA